MKPSEIIGNNSPFWQMVLEWSRAKVGPDAQVKADEIKEWLDGHIPQANDTIVHNTSYTYSMPIPAGYRFSQVGDVVDISPIETATSDSFISGVVTDFNRHTDDEWVDRFAARMKGRLKECRENGKGGWDDPTEYTPNDLAAMMIDCTKKGNPVDIANYCMMIAARESIDGHSFDPDALIASNFGVDDIYAEQQVRNGENMLKVQGALGITESGWVSGDVVMLRIGQLKANSAAMAAVVNALGFDTSQGDIPVEVVVSTIQQLNVAAKLNMEKGSANLAAMQLEREMSFSETQKSIIRQAAKLLIDILPAPQPVTATDDYLDELERVPHHPV